MRSALFLVVVSLVGCGGKVKQQQPPRIPDEAESDMPSGSNDIVPSEPVAEGPVEEPEETVDERTKCCNECAEGYANSGSSDPAGAVNCTSMTTTSCVLWFEKNPMTAGEAQKCSGGGEAGAEEPSDG